MLSPILPPVGKIRSTSLRRQRLMLPHSVFACCWMSVLLVHFVCFVTTAALAGLHALVATPALFTYTASTLQIDIKYLRLAAKTFACVSSLHVLAIIRILYHSVRRRQLCFRSTLISSSGHKLTAPSDHPTASASLVVISTLAWPLRVVVRLWSRYFGIDGVFGLNGAHFDSMFHVRELLEILSQTYQAYFLSTLMSSPWINLVAVGTIVVGCLSTPIIHLFVRRHQMLRRFLCLVMDTMLDLTGSVMIPMIILYRNVREFNWHAMTFPIDMVYDNVWMTQQGSQMRLLFVWSYLDYASTVVLQLSALGCIFAIENGIVSRGRSRATKPLEQESVVAERGPTRDPLVQAQRHVSSAAIQAVTRKRGRPFNGPHVGALLSAWGVFVLFAHVYAQRDPTRAIPECELGINAWFSRRPGCAVVRIHCHRLGITGTADQVSTILNRIERSTLGMLAIMHCPGLVVPDILQEFSQLASMELTNVTLVNWPASAALHRDHHKALSHLFLGHVTLSEFPAGLLHPHLPRTMSDLDISYTNITTIPDAVGEMWADLVWFRLNIENGNLTELPDSFARLSIRRISLAGNRLKHIPDDMFEDDVLTELYVSGNPLETLPASLGERSPMDRFFAEHTRINATNAWWAKWYSRSIAAGAEPRVLFYGSPICNTTDLSPDAQARMCATDFGTAQGNCPWDLIWKLRPV